MKQSEMVSKLVKFVLQGLDVESYTLSEETLKTVIMDYLIDSGFRLVEPEDYPDYNWR